MTIFIHSKKCKCTETYLPCVQLLWGKGASLLICQLFLYFEPGEQDRFDSSVE